MYKYEIRRMVGGREPDREPIYVSQTLDECMKVMLQTLADNPTAEWLDPIHGPIITLRVACGTGFLFYRLWRV